MIIIGDKYTTYEIDENIEKKYKISKEILMENVGFKLFELIDKTKETYLILAGFGNNGGDGLVLARLLNSIGKDVIIFRIENEIYSELCDLNYRRCKSLGIPIINKIEEIKYYLNNVDIVIDAIFGVGIREGMSDNILDVINIINEMKLINKYSVYSIDIPTGLSSESGEVVEEAIKADITYSIITYKKGFLNYNSKEYTGHIHIIKDIIIPNDLLLHHSDLFLIEENDISNFKRERNINSNKTDFGKSFIVSGSDKYIGAAKLATEGCLNVGSGYTYLFSENEKLRELVYNLPEIIFTSNINDLDNAKVLGMGPGITNINTIKILIEKYKNSKKLILDAGAIDSSVNIVNSPNILITPHTGEFSALYNINLELILKNTADIVKDYANMNNINILLKGKNTYISDGIKTYVVNTGNPYMAIAGMGDVLTGIITGLVAQNYSIIESAIIGSYLHGYIADELKKQRYIITPTELVKNISYYMNKLLK
jgi:YjeF C-terminal domain protein